MTGPSAPAPSAFASRFVDIGGPVHVADFGGGGPPVVLVHGLGGSHVNWAGIGPLLAERHRVLAVDLVGFGRTPGAGRSAGFRENRRLVDRFVRQEVGEPAVLVGNSMGGAITVACAAAHPENVAAAVLVCPALPVTRFATKDLEAQRFLLPAMVPGVGEAVMAARRRWETPEQRVERMFDLVCVEPGRVPADVRAAHLSLVRERTPRQQRAMDAHFLRAARTTVADLARHGHAWDRAGRVQCPVLLLHGEGDRLIPVAAARNAARQLPGWELEVMLDVGHTPQLEAPRATADLILAFLARRGLGGVGPRSTGRGSGSAQETTLEGQPS